MRRAYGAQHFTAANVGGDALFNLNVGDIALDGLVIVKAGGFDTLTIPAVPLLKIEV